MTVMSDFNSGYQHAVISYLGDLLVLPSKVTQEHSAVHSVLSFMEKKGEKEGEDCYRGCKTKFPEFTPALVKL